MLSPKAFVSSHRKTNPRGRATLLFLVAMATFLVSRILVSLDVSLDVSV